MLVNEVIYEPVPGCPGYRVGNDGTVWSCWRFRGKGYGVGTEWYLSEVWKQLKPDRRKVDGKKRYTLKYSNGSKCRLFGSHIVLTSFVGLCPEGMEACHNDGDATNDALLNLRWDTHSSNLLDRRKHGTSVCGEDVHTSKLTKVKVEEIRSRRDGGEKLVTIAKDMGVSETMISLIARRRNWQHV
jgi:hypothetical protein